MSDTPNTRVVTPEAVISYPHLFEPWSGQEGQEPKYSATFIFLEGTDISALKAAAIEAGKAKWGEKFEQMLKAGMLRMPFRTDVELKGYPAGSTFVNARSKNRPGVVEPFPGPDNKPQPLIDEDKMFAGCVVRASLTAFAYDTAGNRGVSFSLNNVQWLRTGERLDNRIAAQDEFDAPQQAPADLGDLL